MNKSLIYKYLDKLQKENINDYALKQNINLTDDELSLIYTYIKEYPDKIIDNPLDILLEIKNQITINTYNKLLELYNKYKKS